MSDITNDPSLLGRFQPFENLDSHQLLLLSKQVDWRRVSRGETIFRYGDIDSNEYFLLDGEVELSSNDGKGFRVDHRSSTATRQLARLRPRQYTATATISSILIVVDSDFIDSLQTDSASDDIDYGVSEIGSLEEMEDQELLSEFRSALNRNQFVLPSLPEVAIRVRRLLENDEHSADKIADVINADPSIAAKLIRAANSPVYHGAAQCETTRNAIVRLGLNTTRQLVMSFAVKDLFATESPKLKRSMQKAWQHSVEVAAISYIIAKMIRGGNQTQEEAMLAGLVHDIGVIAILAFVETRPTLVKDDEQLERALAALRGEAGEAILKHWKFPEDFIAAATEVTDWERSHPFDADICDIVQIAKLHSYIWNKQTIPFPRMDSLPAFKKLPLGDLTPELTIRILEEAREQVTNVKKMLNG